MRGVRFVLDDTGEQTAVVIDLKRNRSLWDDFYDCALAESRRHEPREPVEFVRKRVSIRSSRGTGSTSASRG